MKETLFILVFLFYTYSLEAENVDSLLYVLDSSIKERPSTFFKKEKAIAFLKDDLSVSSSEEEKYSLLKTLMDEYSDYKIDSAIYYSDQCIEVATILNEKEYIVESQLKRIYYFCFLSLFHESFEKLDAIDYNTLPVFLQKLYLKTVILVYHNKVKSLESPYSRDFYNSVIFKTIDLYFTIEKEETTEYLSLKAYRYYLQKDLIGAVNVIRQILDKTDLSIHDRADMLLNLGGIYKELGGEYLDEAKVVFSEAAILCNRHAITSNLSLLQFAVLIAEEDYRRAYNYINVAVKDAAVFSVDHKIGLRQKVYNEIQKIYFRKIDQQKIMLEIGLVVNCLLSLIVLCGLILLFKDHRTLRKVRERLVQVNGRLKDSNRIKEVYISHFLNQYSGYIDKVNEIQRHIVRLINAGHSTDIIKREALSSVNTKDDLNDFFIDFDKSILELFPSFVQEVNLLLLPDEAYSIRSSSKESMGKLNTELRILALLRLGVSDNKEIASFFRFTVQTVYNYRSKAKSRAIDETSFEGEIKNICKE